MATSHGTKVSHTITHNFLDFSSLRDVYSSHLVLNKDSSLTYLSKVTKDTRAKEEIPEAVGTVTSGSLAADSLTNGEFGRNNPKADATSQPSRSTTTNNRDTSSATTFEPALDAEAREAREGENEFKPHGKNITEGGFDSNAPYASFDQDIGTEKDPGGSRSRIWKPRTRRVRMILEVDRDRVVLLGRGRMMR